MECVEEGSHSSSWEMEVPLAEMGILRGAEWDGSSVVTEFALGQ